MKAFFYSTLNRPHKKSVARDVQHTTYPLLFLLDKETADSCGTCKALVTDHKSTSAQRGSKPPIDCKRYAHRLHGTKKRASRKRNQKQRYCSSEQGWFAHRTWQCIKGTEKKKKKIRVCVRRARFCMCAILVMQTTRLLLSEHPLR